MPEPNPTEIVTNCIERSKATADPDLIVDYISEALGLLQMEVTEEDAFAMLGGAIDEAVAEDPARTVALFDVWSDFAEQRKLG